MNYVPDVVLEDWLREAINKQSVKSIAQLEMLTKKTRHVIDVAFGGWEGIFTKMYPSLLSSLNRDATLDYLIVENFPKRLSSSFSIDDRAKWMTIVVNHTLRTFVDAIKIDMEENEDDKKGGFFNFMAGPPSKVTNRFIRRIDASRFEYEKIVIRNGNIEEKTVLQEDIIDPKSPYFIGNLIGDLRVQDKLASAVIEMFKSMFIGNVRKLRADIEKVFKMIKSKSFNSLNVNQCVTCLDEVKFVEAKFPFCGFCSRKCQLEKY